MKIKCFSVGAELNWFALSCYDKFLNLPYDFPNDDEISHRFGYGYVFIFHGTKCYLSL